MLIAEQCSTFLLTLFLMNSIDARAAADDFDGFSKYAVHPRTITSNNGLYSVSIDPSDLNGRGPGEYVVKSDGKTLWKKTLPFTLWRGSITNQGTLIGYAYTHGYEGLQGNGDVVIFSINAKGETLVNDSTPREGSRFFHQPPTPLVNAIEMDPANDRFLVRWDDPDINRRQETWVVYSLSTGEKQRTMKPKISSVGHQMSPWLQHLHFIPGTSFVLTQFKLFGPHEPSIAFAIYDRMDAPLWSLERSGEFQASTEELRDALRDKITLDGCILENNNRSQFDLQFIRQEERVRFKIELKRDNAIDVHEMFRKPQLYAVQTSTNESDSGPSAKIEPSLGREWIQVGPIRLQSTKVVPPHPVRDILDGFDFDDAGNIGFLRAANEGPVEFVLVTQEGQVVVELEMPQDPLDNSRWNGVVYVGDQRFVATCSQYDVGAKSRAWSIDTKKQAIHPLEKFQSPPVESIASFRDGGFVIFATERFKYTMTDTVSRYDSQGLVLWTIGKSTEEYPKSLFSPRGMGVTTDGYICVLDGSHNQVQYFDKKGSIIRCVDLKEALGKKPNYLSEISASNDRGLVIYDFHGDPACFELSATGEILNRMNPRIDKERAVLRPMGPPKMSPTGELWISDRTSFLRMGRDGLVDYSLGEAADVEVLGKIDSIVASDSGEIFAISNRTGTIHRFNTEGAPISTISDPVLLDRKFSERPLFALSQADLYAVLPNNVDGLRLAHFSDQGQKIRQITLPGYRVYCQTNDTFLCTEMTTASRYTSNGKLIEKIKRQPDGNWLQMIDNVAVASDGSFAISAFHNETSNVALPASINLYSAEGDPLRTLVIPMEGWDGFDFDGQRLAVSSKEMTRVFSIDGNPLSWTSHRDFSGKSLFIQPKLIGNGSELILIDRNNPGELRRYR